MSEQIKLTREAYDELKKAERRFLDLLPKCDSFEACGIDANQYRGLIQQRLQEISEIEARFATPAPR